MALYRVSIGALLLVLAGCADLPRDVARAPSTTATDTADTLLGRALAVAVEAHPDQTGIYLLENAREAFAVRMLLARTADRSLDVQCYIWRDDYTGRLLIGALWQAAERGVRVRLLLDDNNMQGLDGVLAVLDAHPSIEVRLFNPYANRRVRALEMVADFPRVNRRMHNKSFTADNQATIVGGRNVGDEYFGVGTPVEFADLDMLAAGTVVHEVSRSFDTYWNSESAYPVAALMPPASASDTAQVLGALTDLEENAAVAQYLDAVRDTTLMKKLLAGQLPLQWAPGELISDDPAKVVQPPKDPEANMLPQLTRAIGTPKHQLDLVSPYFVPTQDGAAALVRLAGQGVKVRVLTNSLAATDVPAVHAGYVRYREQLLRAGIALYEMKPRGERRKRSRKGSSSSAESLHAKTFVADRQRVFVGSFNFDPRSVSLNTEMGIVVDSPALGARMAGVLDSSLDDIAYEVRLTPDGLEWIEGDKRHRADPGTTALQRFWVSVMSVLPLEWML